MAQAPRDENHVPALLGASSSDGITPVTIYADPSTHRLYVDANVSISGLTIATATAAAPSYSEGADVALSTDLSGALRVTGSFSVGGTTDNSAYTAGTSTGTPAMGFYHSTIDTVTDGRAAAVAITSKRAMMVNLQTAAGAETGVAASPLQVSLANTAANATAVKVDGSAVTQPVSIAANVTVVGTGTFAVQAANATASNFNAQVVGNIAQGSADSGNPVRVGGTYNVTPPSLSDGARGALQVNATGSLRSVLMDAAGNVRGANVDSSNRLSVTVDNVSATNISTNIAQMNGVTVTMGNGASGTGVQRVTIASDSTGNIASIGTSVTPGTSAAHLGKAEDAAAASGDTGVFVLGVRNETLTAPTGTDGDYTQLSVGSAGEQVVQQAPLSAHVTGNASVAGTGDTSVVAAQGASTYFYATAVTVVNTGSSATLITFKDGNGGSTLFYGIAPAGGGITFNGGGKPLFKTSANTALYFACGTSSTTVYCSVSGFKSKV